jgi:hypothetical protein
MDRNTRTSCLLLRKLFDELDCVESQLDGLFSRVTEDNLAENRRNCVVKVYDSVFGSG